jgi:hypothetical protein
MSASDLVFSHLPHTTATADAALATATAVEAATGDIATWTIWHPTTVTQVGVLITVAVNYDTLTTKAVIAFDKRPTFGSDTGRVEMGRVSIPDGAVAGALYCVDIPTGDAASNEDGDCFVGYQIVAEIVTAGLGGTEVGDFQPLWFGEPMSELPSNNVNGAGSITFIKDTTTTQV